MPPVISLSLLTNCPGVLCKSHLIRPQIGWIYAHPDAKMSFTKHLSHEDGGHWWNYTDSGCRTAPALGSGCLPRVGKLRGFLLNIFSKQPKGLICSRLAWNVQADVLTRHSGSCMREMYKTTPAVHWARPVERLHQYAILAVCAVRPINP